ncbi:beta-tectorin [Lampetra fluviatilis]
MEEAVGISVAVLALIVAHGALGCSPQRADYVWVSCFPNTITATVLECPFGWTLETLLLGGVCLNGVSNQGFYKFVIPDLTPSDFSYCGTQTQLVNQHGTPTYVFTNWITSRDQGAGVRFQPVNYTFSCSYKARYTMETAAFDQSVATIFVKNGSWGSFESQLSMNIFSNSKFSVLKPAPFIVDATDIGSTVFIGIEAKGLSRRFKIVISKCWATPSTNSNGSMSLSLIHAECPSDSTVVIFENGHSQKSTFQFSSFRFRDVSGTSRVWLHCEVRLCDSHRASCSKCHANRCHANQCHVNRCHANRCHANRCHANQCHANRCHANRCLANQCHANRCHANQCHVNRCHANRCLANQCHANRCHANQCHANQCHVNRCHANRCHANRCHANQCHANRCHANRCLANQCHANRCHVNRCHANQCHANRCLANQCHANRCHANQCHANQCHANCCHANRCHAYQCHANRCHANRCHANCCHANQCHANRCHVNRCHANQCHANRCHANRCHANRCHANRCHANQ